MTPKQYRAALKHVGLSINNAGDFLGFSRRQSFRIASGDGELPESARKLLLVMVENDWMALHFAGGKVPSAPRDPMPFTERPRRAGP